MLIEKTVIKKDLNITCHVAGLCFDADWIIATETVDENVLRILQPRN